MPPKAKPGKQVILQQAPQIQMAQDIKAPNLIAFSPAPAPPPARPQPKAFIPPTRRLPPAPAPAPALNEAPRLETSTSGVLPETPKELGNVMAGIAKARRPVKTFVPPASSGRSDRNGDSGPRLDPGSAPAIPGGSSPETFTVAIIGLQPAASLEQIPDGSRPAQLSTGPVVGAPASGSGGNGSGGPGGNSGIRIPDLSVRSGGGKAGEGSGKPGEATASHKPNGGVEYQQTILPPIRSTLSAPLRPSSRTIPALLEARFRGRDVYTIVVPIPNIPQYTGDWILWFAEIQMNTVGPPGIHAPSPVRKIDMLTDAPGGDKMQGRVQLAAIVRKDGSLESISVIKSFDSRIDRSAIEDLQKWKFAPASRGGVPIDADIVVEIPFSLTPGR